ncbi:hypothetical protein F2Q69_00015953 [Brassica cretica]|uniref:Uncharacterized protein n=1 Tax=Brassica cretica TaxID=69181 RepID=A0A8S9R500_BRACR|nr:hypothetical protein F2Q69_00015953 [Brassica cretica]
MGVMMRPELWRRGSYGGGSGGGGGDVVVMKVIMVLLVNVVVDEDLIVSGCVDVVDVTGRVADGALGGGYESGNRERGDTRGGD